MTWANGLLAESLAFAATVLLIVAVTRKPRNRRRPGVLPTPSDACKRNGVEAAP